MVNLLTGDNNPMCKINHFISLQRILSEQKLLWSNNLHLKCLLKM